MSIVENGSAAMSITTIPSPSFTAYHGNEPVRITCDSGANSSLINLSTATRLGLPIEKNRQRAYQADGSRLENCGEVHASLSRDNLNIKLDALVVRKLDNEILGGMPFLKENKMVLDIPNQKIIVNNSSTISYGQLDSHGKDKRIRQCVIRAERRCVIYPGDYIDLHVPDSPADQEVIVKPCNLNLPLWPTPNIIKINNGKLRVANDNREPVIIRKHQHVAMISPVDEEDATDGKPKVILANAITNEGECEPKKVNTNVPSSPYSETISINPDGLISQSESRSFRNLHEQYDDVFNPTISKYNDASGKIRATINMGPVKPPPSKGRQPQYERKNISILQDKFDKLEELGVLGKPEDHGVIVENVSPSFLVNKASGPDFRFVTAFNGIANFAKPPPSRSTDPDDIIRFLAKWPFIITSDMTDQFHQLPLDKKSMKYAGVMSPYKGTRVYLRAAMGMPGSTEHLDELMCRVLGDLVHEGVANKIADDLYVGGKDANDLLYNWSRTLEKFKNNNLRLKAKKTIIAPKSTTVLGWVWQQGVISVSPHKINPLATADPPKTVKGLRSWIGAYKHMKACISQYSALLSPLEAAVGRRESREEIVWSSELLRHFDTAKTALSQVKAITTPRPSDQLIITSDGAVRNRGIGSILYVVRNGEMKLGGHYSMKLSETQTRWLPCEVEALGIASAINHWAKSIKESKFTTKVLTDSKPCVQAYLKLCKGEFSNSARVSTFLSTISRYRVTLQHISASANLPADYLSRNPMECTTRDCQVCKFSEDLCTSAVLAVSVSDILERRVPMPFTNPQAWKNAQQECPDLRRVVVHLQHGTRPNRKSRGVKIVKEYLRSVTIGPAGLLVVKRIRAFRGNLNLTVIPSQMLYGLVTAIHLRLSHPSFNQLQKVFNCNFFALNSEEVLRTVTDQCAQCASLKNLPTEIPVFSTSDKPATCPGKSFASDIIRRNGQMIMVTRDAFSSYTLAVLVPDETACSLRDGLLLTCSPISAMEGATIRSDPGPGFQGLVDDKILQSHGLLIEIGRCKNINKNPIAEKAVRELEEEICKMKPDGGRVSNAELAIATKTLNNRIRNRGLSASEILTQRDQYQGTQLTIRDIDLAEKQVEIRNRNHPHSANSKAPRGEIPSNTSAKVGDLVFIKSDREKHSARPQYIVISCDDKNRLLQVRKLSGSGFRSKLYTVKYSDIYSVPGATAALPRNIPTYNDHESSLLSDIESDTDQVPEPPPVDIVPVRYPIPPDINQDDNGELDNDIELNREPIPPDINQHVREPIPPDIIVIPPDIENNHGQDIIPTGRGRRNRSKPSWQTSGEYDMSR